MKVFSLSGLLCVLLWHAPLAAQQNPTPRSSGERSPTAGATLQDRQGNDLLTVEKSISERLLAKDTFSYEIKVTNISDNPVQGIVVHESFGGKLTVKNVTSKRAQKDHQSKASESSKASKKEDDSKSKDKKSTESKNRSKENSVEFEVGTLKAGESETIRVTARAANAGQINTCLWLDYNQNTSMCSVLEIVDPELELSAELEVDRELLYEACEEINGFYSCDDVNLVIRVANPGDGSTAPATVMIELPKGLKAATAQNSGNKGKLELGEIESGKAIKAKIALSISDPKALTENQSVTVTATAGELKASSQDDLKLKLLQPKLAVNIKAPSKHYANSSAQYQIEVANTGSSPIVDARVVLQRPENVNRFTINGGKLEEGELIAVGCLKSGETKNYTVTMNVDQPGEVVLLVKADGYCVDTIEKQSKLKVMGIPAIRVEVVDKIDPVPVGEETVYEITLKNQGTADDIDINLTGKLPKELEFIDGSGDTSVKHKDGEITFGNLKKLSPGKIVTWYVRAKAVSAAKTRMKLDLTSQANPEPVTEEEPTNLFKSTSASEE